MSELIKVKDMTIGYLVNTALLVLSATARKTKAGKPYLSLELFDGTEKINGNYWDWKGSNIPTVSSVLDVEAQVTEWSGSKQLNISSISYSEAYEAVSFMPMSEYDIAEKWIEADELITGISDEFLRELTMSLYGTLKELWMDSPSALSIHHAFVGGNLVHSVSVAKKARALAEATEGACVDLCVAGALLHDVGKLYTYCYEGAKIAMTDEGMLYGHLFIGTELVGNYAEDACRGGGFTKEKEQKLELLRHVIASHHGKQEWGAIISPMCIEAHIVHYADALDASTELIVGASDKNPSSKWTDKLFTVGNVPHINYNYVRLLFNIKG